MAETAAIGRLGANGIEEVALAIVPRHPVSEQAIIEWCSKRGIPIARVLITSELPKTESGKIQHIKIRQLFEAN